MINSVGQNTQQIQVPQQVQPQEGFLSKAKTYALSAADTYVSSNEKTKANINLGLNMLSLAGLVGVLASGKHKAAKAVSAVVAFASTALSAATNFINKGTNNEPQKDVVSQEIQPELAALPQEQVQAPQA